MQISKQEKLEQLDRILHGKSLQGSESLKAFLRFVVDKSVDDQESRLKEYVIATEVFGRSGDFDSRIDSVVRVQAGRLRVKLHEYYETEGREDRLVVDLPKGQYIPVFYWAPERRGPETSGAKVGEESSNGVISDDAGPAGKGPDAEAQESSPRITWPAINTGIWQAATLILAATSILLLFYTYRNRPDAAESARRLSLGPDGTEEALDRKEVDPLWGTLLGSSEAVLVVFSNTLFQGTAEEGMKLLKSLDSPGSSLGSPSIPQGGIEQTRQPISEHYTGIGEVMGAYFLGDFMAKVGHQSRIKRSLLLNWEDLKTENIIVLGSPAENLFLRDLPQKQEFVFRPNLIDAADGGKKAFGIVNTKPKPGEQPFYFATQGGPSRSQISEDYALVSLLQGLNSKNRLLILAGITTLGTQAAAEYVTKPTYIKDMIRRLNIAPVGETPRLPANYQVLVRVRVNGGVPVQISYVTHHVLN